MCARSRAGRPARVRPGLARRRLARSRRARDRRRLPTIPFLDLAGLHGELREPLDLAWRSVLTHGRFVGGPEVDGVRGRVRATTARSGTASAVGNGTDALELVLAGPGDRPRRRGDRPDEHVRRHRRGRLRRGRDAAVRRRPAGHAAARSGRRRRPRSARARRRSSPCTCSGRWPTSWRCRRSRERHGLALIEDAAQAHGAGVRGAPGGQLGCGRHVQLLPRQEPRRPRRRRRRRVRRQRADRADPQPRRPRPVAVRTGTPTIVSGRNSRLDTLQAAVLTVKLPGLDAANRSRVAAVAALPRRAAGVVRARRRAPDGRAGVPPRRGPGARPQQRSRVHWTRRASAGGCTIPCPATASPRSPGTPTGRCRWRRPRRPASCRCRCSRR